jgi:hypothetical protein
MPFGRQVSRFVSPRDGLKGFKLFGAHLGYGDTQVGDFKLSILAMTLALSLTAAAQEHWDPSHDWLSAGTKIYRSPYYLPSSNYYHSYDYPYYRNYPYYPYSLPPGYVGFPSWKSSSFYPIYPAWAGPYPRIGGVQPSKAWWIGLQQDWIKTLSYARSQSSVLVYRDGAWQPP